MSESLIKVAAVQIETSPGRLADNLEHVERLAESAFAAGARLVCLPEFFPGALIPRDDAYECVLAPANVALAMMERLARRHNGYIGGSMLIARDGDVYNTYHFVQPDGAVFRHDKDLPTMWENAFYAGGNDDGAFETDIGKVGAAVCWELIRWQTVKRLAGRVDIALTGTHWWSVAENWRAVRSVFAPMEQYNRYLSEQAPVEFARRLGVPVVQAAHCGRIAGDLYLLPGTNLRTRYETRFVGATQIVNACGVALASRNAAEGPGFITADVEIGAIAPLVPQSTDRFWIPELTVSHKLYWHHQNMVCRDVYRRFGRDRGLRVASRGRAD